MKKNFFFSLQKFPHLPETPKAAKISQIMQNICLNISMGSFSIIFKESDEKLTFILNIFKKKKKENKFFFLINIAFFIIKMNSLIN